MSGYSKKRGKIRRGTKKSRYQKCSLWYERSNFIKTRWKIKKIIEKRKSSYIIRDDVPDGKCPRCCFCLRPRFVLLHRLVKHMTTATMTAI